jgi:hypothetical protein
VKTAVADRVAWLRYAVVHRQTMGQTPMRDVRPCGAVGGVVPGRNEMDPCAV